MKTLKQQAAIAVVGLASLLGAGSAMAITNAACTAAGGTPVGTSDCYFPEGTTTTPGNTTTTNTNTNTNTANGGTSTSNATGGNATANGGAGGAGGNATANGGLGGAGGNATGGAGGNATVGNVSTGASTATVGNVAGGTATVGNVAGGTATVGNVSTGASTATTGAVTNDNKSSANNALNNNINNSTTFNEAKQVGIAPPVYLNNNSDCGEGWSLSIGVIGGAAGGGKTGQSRVCLSQKAALAILNSGILIKDDGMIVGAMETLAALHPEIKVGLEKAGIAFATTCIEPVLKKTRVLAVGLTQERCDRMKASGAFNNVVVMPVVVSSPAPAPAPVALEPAPVALAAPAPVAAAAPVLPVKPDCKGLPLVYNPEANTYKCGRDLTP